MSIQETKSAAASFALQLPGLFFPIGLIVTGVFLARTASAPAWAAVLLVVGAVMFPMARIPDLPAVAVAGDILLLVALGSIAWLPAPNGSPPRSAAAGHTWRGDGTRTRSEAQK